MLRRFSGLLCSKYCFYSLIFAFIISLGCINTANAYVCFLPDGADCAQGDTEGFWPCVGSDCEGGENDKCDVSYNSNMSTNECGAACTRCSDASSPYNGLYKCPENTCNCNEYTSTEAFNECGDSCKVCRIAGDKNYGKYKCPAVPASGCSNPQCEDYTLTKSQADNITANGGVCEQCTNKNAPANRQKLFKCEDCNPDIYTNTLEGCKKKGYDSAKDKCPTGDVYQTCCNTCDGHIFPTDLSKTSEGWSCTPCPNSCADGGTKYSCECKTGYHDNGNGGCAKDCAVVTCNAVTIPANAHGTTTCQAKNADCSNNGSEVYTAWECDTGYHKNSASTACVANVVSCPSGYESKDPNVSEEDFIFDWVDNDDYFAQDCDPTQTQYSETGCPYKLQYGTPLFDGTQCVKVVNVGSCLSGYESKDPNVSEEDFIFDWVSDNDDYFAQDCDPTQAQYSETGCPYKLQYGTPLSDGTQCVKVVNVVSCTFGYESKDPNVSEEDFIFGWVWDNDRDHAQYCDPTQYSETGCPYKLQYGTPLSNGTQCVKIKQLDLSCPSGYKRNSAGTGCECMYYTGLSTCQSSGYATFLTDYSHICYNVVDNCYAQRCDENKGYYEDERDCEELYGQGNCEEKYHCYVEKYSSGGNEEYTCECPYGWHACNGGFGPNTESSGYEGVGSDGQRCDCCKD